MDLSPRLRAVCDLDVATVREYSGRHEYDGKPQDLSPGGVRAGLARLAAARDGGERLADPHDEAHLTAVEDLRRVTFAELEMHRRNPILHLAELALATYDRDYAPAAEQAVHEAALAAHARLVAHLERTAADGDPDPALGEPAFSALMSSAEALPVDVARLAAQADSERDRLLALLAEGCAQVAPGRPALEVARELVRVHPDARGVIDAGQLWAQRAIDFTRDKDLVPYHDGECRVGLAPESRRWAMAMMTPAAPGEPD